MSRKVFAFDIDGTFLNDKHEVQQSHIDALLKAKEKGHINVLCSGRPYFDMIPVLDQVPNGLFDFAICNNGAYNVDLTTMKRIMENEVPKELLKEVRSLSSISKFAFAIHTIDGVYRGKLWGDDEETPKWFYTNNENMEEKMKHFISWDEAVSKAMKERISQISLIGTKENIQEALSVIKSKEHNVDIHIAGEIYLDVNPDGISKQTGIENLSKMVNIPVSEFVVFGDSGNDLQMLRGAGLGVAMGNATVEAKDAANIVIGNNNTTALADKVLELI